MHLTYFVLSFRSNFKPKQCPHIISSMLHFCFRCSRSCTRGCTISRMYAPTISMRCTFSARMYNYPACMKLFVICWPKSIRKELVFGNRSRNDAWLVVTLSLACLCQVGKPDQIKTRLAFLPRFGYQRRHHVN